MKKFNRENATGFTTITLDEPCEICGEKADVLLTVHKYLNSKSALLCHECRRKWLRGEINL